MKNSMAFGFPRLTPLLLTLVVAVALAGPAYAGGPVVLMGIDAEDGGVGGHGPLANYVSVVNSMIPQTTAGAGILVIGGGKNAGDNVTTFWNSLAAATTPALPVTFVNGAANITGHTLLSGSTPIYKIIAVASDVNNTPFGGLTQAENDALALRAADIAGHVNGGGGLIGMSSVFPNPYPYLGAIGAFTFALPPQFSNITPTAGGMAIGVTDALDICCWHQEYLTFPSFLQVLALNANTQNPCALGGAQVTIPAAGRMTGGGSIGTTDVRHGFELHCDKNQLPNRLEVNWGRGNRFHLEVLNAVTCTDDPNIDPGQPKANFDTMEGRGTGRFNGVSGATIEFLFTDAGEPGRNDRARILIRDAGNNVVLNVDGTLNSGNHQAHH